MTPADVGPGSALADPYLWRAWADRVWRLEAEAGSGGAKERRRLAYAVDIRSILAAYPWQRLAYRYGRWEPEETLWKSAISLNIWDAHHWVSNDSSFQLLDPYSWRRLGEFEARPGVLTMPGGMVDFAGDPASLGVYRPVGAGIDAISLGTGWRRLPATLRRGIDALRAGAACLPPHQPIDLDLFDRYRAWYVDEPAKPSRKAPNLFYLRMELRKRGLL